MIFARNACFNIAKNIGVRYFLELDDDYSSFEYRWIENEKLKEKEITGLNNLFETYLKFLDESGAYTVAMAQGGDFIGGAENGNFHKRLLRKAMNTFFCDTTKPFRFVGRINEDVNTYVTAGMQGKLFFTCVDSMIIQEQTQKSAGGMTDTYLKFGTYLKSFYPVIFQPSCVKVEMMGAKHERIHHQINWNNCCPVILNERYKKK